MEIYTVGGAVRDELLGIAVQDRDYVVVGSSPAEMIERGFRPVGRDFPVFLHPQTNEEYALARTERKVARGYRGFTIYASPDVTLEEDLARRDLTINAIARDAQGRIIDPFGGAADLKAGILRHVGPAFAEDPVRILRAARFSARFSFEVAAETMALMQRMVREGESDALVAERAWQEISRGLMERSPRRMFAVLAEAGLLARLLPELGLEFENGAPANDAARVSMAALDHAQSQGYALPERYAVLSWGLRAAGSAEARLRAVSARLHAPNDCCEIALIALRHAGSVKRAPRLGAPALLALLEACDAFRRPSRLDALVRTCEAESFGERGWMEIPYAGRALVHLALAAAMAIDPGAIARRSAKPQIAENIRAARLQAIRGTLAGARRR